ncbi:hypothetical protein NBRC116583_25960 [Arenicella sp. 4NH20-0111]
MPVLQLTAGRDAPPLNQYVRYSKSYNDDLSLVLQSNHNWQAVLGASIQFGRAASNIVILLRVKNTSDSTGEWVLSTGRGSATSLQIYQLQTDNLTLRFDSDNYEKARQVLQTYLHYADPITLLPEEEKTLIVRSDVEDSAYFPLTLQAKENYFIESNLTLILAAGCTAAIFALLLLNLFFYIATGRPEFVWLVTAEFFLACMIMYLVGFFSTYFFYDKPIALLAVFDLIKYGYLICMSQFARIFIKTSKRLPKTDIFLKFLITLSAIMIAIQFFSAFIPTSIRIQMYALNTIVVAISTFYFFFIGVYATRKLGTENWPLIVSWGSLAFYAAYASLAYSGTVASIPMNFYVIAPVGVIEAAFATLAIGLNIRKSENQHEETKEAYLQSLEDKLEISKAAQRLAEERSSALATVVDQSALLHASGHDSQQVILALNSALDAVERSGGKLQAKDISAIIESSSDYLNKIVSTTMSGARISGASSNTIALSCFSFDELIQPIEKMYKGLFSKKGLFFSITPVSEEITVVSDRAVLTRVISNLISNSLKFTKSGGVTLTALVRDSQLVITVNDSGQGVDQNLADKLNHAGGQRVLHEQVVKGSGSGFSYSQRMLTKLGGNLKIFPKAEGTLVEISLTYFEEHTPYDMDDLPANLGLSNIQTRVIDWDNLDVKMRRTELMRKKDDRIAITFDDSAALRQELSNTFNLIIYKPLTKSLAAAVNQLT